ncbi:MAG: hypothetical protein ACTSQ8_22220 [Candidatus Helarchaeota archaeon]
MAEDVNQNFTDIQTWANNLPVELDSGLLKLSKIYNDEKGSPSLSDRLVIQKGWNYGVGTDSPSTTTNVTIPIAYDNVEYELFLTMLGVKNTVGAPENRQAANSNYGDFWIVERATIARTTNSFSVYCHRNGGNIGVGLWPIFSWMTIGTIS